MVCACVGCGPDHLCPNENQARMRYEKRKVKKLPTRSTTTVDQTRTGQLAVAPTEEGKTVGGRCRNAETRPLTERRCETVQTVPLKKIKIQFLPPLAELLLYLGLWLMATARLQQNHLPRQPIGLGARHPLRSIPTFRRLPTSSV